MNAARNAKLGNRCIQMAYLDRNKATDAKRQIYKQHGVSVQPVYCDACGKLHLRCETWPPVSRWRDILILLARGLRRREIARTLSMREQSVAWAIYQMTHDWNALSQAHLIIKLTSFGIIRPEEFMLLEDDQAKFRTRDRRKAVYSDAV